MSRKFQTVDYDAVLYQTIRVHARRVLPEQHLARFIVGAIGQFDLTARQAYERYGERGGEAIAPQALLGLLLYGYASVVFSSRKLERATYESIPFGYVTGGLHPDPTRRGCPLRVKMAFKLRTAIGHAIYRVHRGTVEPMIGIVKEVLQFRQFWLRGLAAVAGEWTLPVVCSADSSHMAVLRVLTEK